MKLAKITLAENENEKKCNSWTVNIVLMIVVFTIFTELLLAWFITIGIWLKIMFLAFNLVFTKKQRFGKHINVRNQTNKY